MIRGLARMKNIWQLVYFLAQTILPKFPGP